MLPGTGRYLRWYRTTEGGGGPALVEIRGGYVFRQSNTNRLRPPSPSIPRAWQPRSPFGSSLLACQTRPPLSLSLPLAPSTPVTPLQSFSWHSRPTVCSTEQENLSRRAAPSRNSPTGSRKGRRKEAWPEREEEGGREGARRGIGGLTITRQ